MVTDSNVENAVEQPTAKEKPTRIEAYGVKGLRSQLWRRTFASAAKLDAWCEKHDATVLGTRVADGA